jgi:opacity protein-like surface antigen
LQQVSNPSLTGGFQVGYRRQLDLARASGIYGVEFSANFSNASFNKEYGSPFGLYQLYAKNELKHVCLLQLIGGMTADRVMLFLAAGLSYANISGTVTNLDAIAFFHAFNVSNKVFGTALGGGAEYAINDQFSARFKVDVITPNTYTVANDTGGHYFVSNSIVEGTVGINYRFA